MSSAEDLRRIGRGAKMKCIDKKIGNYLPEYLDKKLSGLLRHEFELHLFECKHCWQKVRQENENEKIDSIIAEYGKKTLSKAQQNIAKEKEPSTDVRVIKDRKPILTIPVTRNNFSYSKPLPGSGKYSVEDMQGRILWQKNIVILGRELRSFRDESIHPSVPASETIRIVSAQDGEAFEINVSLKYRKNRLVLFLSSKDP